jgi:glycosyltransferase involved in cell wall biosynthesis
LSIFHPGSDDQLRAHWGLSPGETGLLFVGGLDRAHHFKGLDVALHALSALTAMSWKLIVVGSGERRPYFEDEARRVGIAGRVVFAGDLDPDTLPRAYRAADLHLFPSTDRTEAFGLVNLEAAATAVPTIASSLPGVRTAVRHEQTGLCVPPADVPAWRVAIARLLSDAEWRRRLGTAARAVAQRDHAWPPLIDRLEKTYREVLDSSGRQS